MAPSIESDTMVAMRTDILQRIEDALDSHSNCEMDLRHLLHMGAMVLESSQKDTVLSRLRLHFASVLVRGGQCSQALEQLDAAQVEIDNDPRPETRTHRSVWAQYLRGQVFLRLDYTAFARTHFKDAALMAKDLNIGMSAHCAFFVGKIELHSGNLDAAEAAMMDAYSGFGRCGAEYQSDTLRAACWLGIIHMRKHAADRRDCTSLYRARKFLKESKPGLERLNQWTIVLQNTLDECMLQIAHIGMSCLTKYQDSQDHCALYWGNALLTDAQPLLRSSQKWSPVMDDAYLYTVRRIDAEEDNAIRIMVEHGLVS